MEMRPGRVQILARLAGLLAASSLALAALPLTVSEAATIRIRLEKSVFLPAEPIVVQIIVENETAWPVAVPTFDPADGFLRFTLLRGEGEHVPYLGHSNFLAGIPRHALAPGDSLCGVYDLLDGFTWPPEPPVRVRTLRVDMRYLPPSGYTLSADLREAAEADDSSGHSEIHSNTVAFSVMEPVGEDALAFQAYKRAMKDDLGRPSGRPALERGLPFLEVAEEYPATRYAPMALLKAAQISAWYGDWHHSIEDLRRSLDEYELVIRRYPGTHEADRAVQLKESALEKLAAESRGHL